MYKQVTKEDLEKEEGIVFFDFFDRYDTPNGTLVLGERVILTLAGRLMIKQSDEDEFYIKNIIRYKTEIGFNRICNITNGKEIFGVPGSFIKPYEERFITRRNINYEDD